MIRGGSMYSHEIQQLLEYRNYLISNEEYFNICRTSPQISGVQYRPFEQNYYIQTKDNYNFKFKVYKKEK